MTNGQNATPARVSIARLTGRNEPLPLSDGELRETWDIFRIEVECATSDAVIVQAEISPDCLAMAISGRGDVPGRLIRHISPAGLSLIGTRREIREVLLDGVDRFGDKKAESLRNALAQLLGQPGYADQGWQVDSDGTRSRQDGPQWRAVLVRWVRPDGTWVPHPRLDDHARCIELEATRDRLTEQLAQAREARQIAEHERDCAERERLADRERVQAFEVRIAAALRALALEESDAARAARGILEGTAEPASPPT